MALSDVFASCAPGVAECNDTGAPFLAGDNAWVGAVAAIVVVTMRLLRRGR